MSVTPTRDHVGHHRVVGFAIVIDGVPDGAAREPGPAIDLAEVLFVALGSVFLAVGTAAVNAPPDGAGVVFPGHVGALRKLRVRCIRAPVGAFAHHVDERGDILPAGRVHHHGARRVQIAVDFGRRGDHAVCHALGGIHFAGDAPQHDGRMVPVAGDHFLRHLNDVGDVLVRMADLFVHRQLFPHQQAELVGSFQGGRIVGVVRGAPEIRAHLADHLSCRESGASWGVRCPCRDTTGASSRPESAAAFR